MTLIQPLFAFVLTFCFLLILKPIANRIDLIDIPGGRKQHHTPTPLVGGIGIYLGLLGASLFSGPLLAQYMPLLTLTGIILIIGVFDDLHELRVSLRFGIHLLVALLMVLWGNNVMLSLGNLFESGPIALGLISIPLTLFATVGVINAVNMTDGVDGLCGGMILVATICLGTVAYVSHQGAMTSFLVLLGVALLAFLALNFRRPWGKCAAVYLGDAGSTVLGFIMAWLIIDLTQGPDASIAPIYALWFLAVPIIDTVSLLILRPLSGISPFKAGTDHLHHRLMRAGLSRGQVVTGMFCTSALFGATGLAAWRNGVEQSVMFWSFIGLFLAYLLSNWLYARSHSATAV